MSPCLLHLLMLHNGVSLRGGELLSRKTRPMPTQPELLLLQRLLTFLISVLVPSPPRCWRWLLLLLLLLLERLFLSTSAHLNSDTPL